MRRRKAIALAILFAGFITALAGSVPSLIDEVEPTVQQWIGVSNSDATASVGGEALTALEQLQVKGRAPKTGYSRDQFGSGWSEIRGCTTRNIILNRDMTNVVIDDECRVESGTLNDPYTGETIYFNRDEASAVQIDHVVALSDAWQKGAQLLDSTEREDLANDPLNLLAVDGSANQQKSDGDAATWLPSNKGFRCEYIARQIAVKKKYSLWVTEAEKKAMLRILDRCPHQQLPEA